MLLTENMCKSRDLKKYSLSQGINTCEVCMFSPSNHTARKLSTEVLKWDYPLCKTV